MSKMTDEEIKRALECCIKLNAEPINYEICKKDCPYKFNCCDKEKGIYFEKDVLDLINRQQAELDDLKRDTIPKLQDSLKRANKYGLETDRENEQLKAEIERLGKAENFEHNVTKLFDKYKVHIKSEAIKECLGKIEQMDVSESDDYIMIKKYNFDNLVKEMVGEQK